MRTLPAGSFRSNPLRCELAPTTTMGVCPRSSLLGVPISLYFEIDFVRVTVVTKYTGRSIAVELGFLWVIFIFTFDPLLRWVAGLFITFISKQLRWSLQCLPPFDFIFRSIYSPSSPCPKTKIQSTIQPSIES